MMSTIISIIEVQINVSDYVSININDINCNDINYNDANNDIHNSFNNNMNNNIYYIINENDR